MAKIKKNSDNIKYIGENTLHGDVELTFYHKTKHAITM